MGRMNISQQLNEKEDDNDRTKLLRTKTIKVCEVCQLPTEKLCQGCKAVNYCSKACQMSNWKAHKPSCKKPNLMSEKSSKTDHNTLKDETVIKEIKRNLPLSNSNETISKKYEIAPIPGKVMGIAVEYCEKHGLQWSSAKSMV